MTSSVAVSPADIEAAPHSDIEATTQSDGEAASSSGRKGAAFLLATLLMLCLAGAWGYTQWWVPRQHAQQVAQVKYDQCLDEVKAYVGTDSYPDRVSQCANIYTG